MEVCHILSDTAGWPITRQMSCNSHFYEKILSTKLGESFRGLHFLSKWELKLQT